MVQQQYCTTSERRVPEDDGRSLLAVDQYRVEVKEIGRLDLAQERELVEMARAGDEEARARLIESCLEYVFGLAWRYYYNAEQHSDSSEVVLDLAQAGNEAIVRHLDEALRGRCPCAFLRQVACHAMIEYCYENKSIRVPRCSRGRAPATVSLDAPVSEADRTLLDLLEDTNWQEAAVSDACGRECAVHEAIGRLTLHQQASVLYSYGFSEHGKHTDREAGRALGVCPSTIRTHTTNARRKLRKDVALCVAVGVEVAQ
jgi:DNA-directed RNA polymerase sigma subunit (sigma70/sigma32)